MSKPHPVQQGECIFSIAHQYKLAPATLWDFGENQGLKDLRGDPNVLFPGDIVHIPDATTETFQRQTGKRYTFFRSEFLKELQVQVKSAGEVLANKPYELDVDGVKTGGTTDGEGWVRAKLKPNANLAKLSVGGEVYALKLGALDPANTITGLQARLQRAGFYLGELDGVVAEPFFKAVRDFQATHGLPPTGDLDDATFDQLIAACGS